MVPIADSEQQDKSNEMVTCPGCGRRFSRQEVICPRCGWMGKAPYPGPKLPPQSPEARRSISPDSPGPRRPSLARFTLLFVACCAISLLPLLPLPFLWPPPLGQGASALVLLAIAFIDQLRPVLNEEDNWPFSSLGPVVLSGAIVLVHDLVVVGLSDELTVLVWLPLLVLNVAVATRAHLVRARLSSALVLVVATYLLSVCVFNASSVHIFHGMFYMVYV